MPRKELDDMISCKEASEYAVKKSEGKLSFKQRFDLWLHQAICKMCKTFQKQIDWIDGVAPKISSNETFSPQEKLEIKEKLDRVK